MFQELFPASVRGLSRFLSVSVLNLYHRDQLRTSFKEHLVNIVAPDLPESIRDNFIEAAKTEKLQSMPNSFLPPTSNLTEGLILLGDAFNMRHPLTGGGMTVALWDVVHLRELLSSSRIDLRDPESPKKVHSQLNRFFSQRKSRASVINILAMALYTLVSANDSDQPLKDLRESMIQYFHLGGICSSHPSGLLSGTLPSPVLLFCHFFAVALYGMYRVLLSSTSITNLFYQIYRSLAMIWTATVVFVPLLWSEWKP